MRLWSLHPVYLDTKGLVACWREGLLARKVLGGGTKGYRNHPQLERFRAQAEPVTAIDSYLLAICEEATRRGFAFKREKIGLYFLKVKITVTDGQLEYELSHLKAKLLQRNPEQYRKIASVTAPLHHPVFSAIKGGLEPWEKKAKEIGNKG